MTPPIPNRFELGFAIIFGTRYLDFYVAIDIANPMRSAALGEARNDDPDNPDALVLSIRNCVQFLNIIVGGLIPEEWFPDDWGMIEAAFSASGVEMDDPRPGRTGTIKQVT